MSVAWTIEYDGITKSLQDWGISSCTVQRFNLATEVLRFTIPVADIYADPVMDVGQVVKLYRDGVCQFIGTVRRTPAAASGAGEAQQYIVTNAWQDLETIIYQQQYVVYDAEATTKLGSFSSRVVLGKNQFGIKIEADEVIRQVGAYANAVGGGLVTFADFGPYAIPPMETVRDITCAEAIRRMIGYAPDAVGAFSYDSGGAVLNIKQRGGLSTVTLDLADKDLVEVIDGLTPLDDIKPRGVVLVFLTSEEVDGVGTVLRETRDTAGATTGPRVVFATVELATGEAVPTGLATQYYNALSTSFWQGTLRLKERECSGLLRPGKMVNLTNGRTAWATMSAIVQSTSEDILHGVTEVELGAPEHLGLSDFVDLMRRWRQRNLAGAFAGTQDNGTAGVSDMVDGTDPAGGGLGVTGGDPDTAEGDRTSNDGAGNTPPGVQSYITVRYCDITNPASPVTRYARVLGSPVSTPTS